MKNDNICKKCKYYRERISSDAVFIERIEVCCKTNEEYPVKIECNEFQDVRSEVK
jgi:hypothetical protein